MDDPYRLVGRLHVPPKPVAHRNEDYAPSHLAVLRDMEERHFWYRGRHRFLLHGVHTALERIRGAVPPRLIDLGGGCGGWIGYLLERASFAIGEAALGDSSALALEHAGERLRDDVELFHLDLRNLQWTDRWDVVFLLDVLEHLPDDGRVLSEVYKCLSPGGILFITVPALDFFWTWNDEAVKHRRRYARGQLSRLASETGFAILECRYFMFVLSPLLILSRWIARPRADGGESDRMEARLRHAHRTPSRWLNELLFLAFSLETPLGHAVAFPWGTSLLAVVQKPR